MKHTYSQLDLDDRRKIERWRHAGVAVDVIAEKLGRHRSTIFRELARNKFEDAEMPELTGYFCVAANGKSGIVELTGDDRAKIYGALIWIAEKLKSEDGERARELWAEKGMQAFGKD